MKDEVHVCHSQAHHAGAVAKIKAVATAEGATLPPPPPTVADMTDSWRAKVTVTAEQQADCGKLAAVYDGMRDAFKREGLNVAAIRATLCASSLLFTHYRPAVLTMWTQRDISVI